MGGGGGGLARVVTDVAVPRLYGRYMALSALSWSVGFAHGPAVGAPVLDAWANAVWLGAYLGKQKAVWAEHRGLRLGVPEDEPPNGFVTTFTTYRVLFQVVGHFTKGGATFDDRRLFAAGLWPIAPIRRDLIDWPRERLAFDDDEVADLARSISG